MHVVGHVDIIALHGGTSDVISMIVAIFRAVHETAPVLVVTHQTALELRHGVKVLGLPVGSEKRYGHTNLANPMLRHMRHAGCRSHPLIIRSVV
jgi:hypothetical protein